MKKLISIVLISTIISFINNLFGQKKLLDTDVFRKNPSEVTSFEEAQKEAEKILQYLIQEELIPGASITVTKQGKTIWQAGYGYADLSKKTPIDRILFEKDGPFLPPQSVRKNKKISIKFAQPADIKEIMEVASEVKDCSYETLERKSDENYEQVFLN